LELGKVGMNLKKENKMDFESS